MDLRYAPPPAAAPAAPPAAAAPATPAATVEAGFGGEMTQARKKNEAKKIYVFPLVFGISSVLLFLLKWGGGCRHKRMSRWPSF